MPPLSARRRLMPVGSNDIATAELPASRRVYPTIRRVQAMPSTVIRNTSYDPATRILSVWFVPSGYRYDYEDVTPETYAAFRQASSKGRFFNDFIRDRHVYRRVANSA